MRDLQSTLKSKINLHFRENGEFKILVLSDVHGRTDSLPENVQANIRLLIDREKPDLIMLNGDNIAHARFQDPDFMRRCIDDMMGYAEQLEIPWMHVYGNHDSQFGFSREAQQEVYESYPHCISKRGEKDIHGVGNYIIPIYASDSEKIAFAVWGLDSGDYLEDQRTTLFPLARPLCIADYIRGNQIEWYLDISRQLEAQNGGKPVYGIAAFHIPLPEFATAWNHREGLTWVGEKREGICCASHNSGFFTAAMERGDIKAILCGHDHINDFAIDYAGIKLCYVGSPSDTTYHHDDIMGGRVVILSEKDPANIKTYMSYLIERESDSAPALPSGFEITFDDMPKDFSMNQLHGAALPAGSAIYRLCDGIGHQNARALAFSRADFSENGRLNNTEIKWRFEKEGKLAQNRYLVAHLNLEECGVDLRKASFGLFGKGDLQLPYRTDEKNEPTPYYYLPDGSTEWETRKTDVDGCFGSNEEFSVKGCKGWFAFPIEHMLQANTKRELTPDTIVDGGYLYFCLSSAEMAGKEIYLDRVLLLDDYRSLLS